MKRRTPLALCIERISSSSYAAKAREEGRSAALPSCSSSSRALFPRRENKRARERVSERERRTILLGPCYINTASRHGEQSASDFIRRRAHSLHACALERHEVRTSNVAPVDAVREQRDKSVHERRVSSCFLAIHFEERGEAFGVAVCKNSIWMVRG